MSHTDTPTHVYTHVCMRTCLWVAPLSPFSFLNSQVTTQLETPARPLPTGQGFFLTLAPVLGNDNPPRSLNTKYGLGVWRPEGVGHGLLFGEQGLSAHSWGTLGYWGFGFLCFPHWAAVRAQEPIMALERQMGVPLGASRFTSQFLAALPTPPLYLTSKGSTQSSARCQGNVPCPHPSH